MPFVEHEIRLSTHTSGFASPEAVGVAIQRLPLAARAAANMAIEGRGQHVGRPTKWETDFAEIRFASAEPDRDDMVLHFLAPQLGEVAGQLYEQRDFWERLPSQDSTAIDLLTKAVAAVSSNDGDSALFDDFVLKRILSLRPAMAGVDRISLCGRELKADTSEINPTTFQHIVSLQRATPSPQQTRLVGRLDMLRDSTQAFSLLLDDGTEVAGIYKGEVADLTPLFRQRVVAVGQLIFRPSGSALRLEAEMVREATRESAIWARLPDPPSQGLLLQDLRRRQGPKSGLSAIFGIWPGDEDDETVNQALAELS